MPVPTANQLLCLIAFAAVAAISAWGFPYNMPLALLAGILVGRSL